MASVVTIKGSSVDVSPVRSRVPSPILDFGSHSVDTVAEKTDQFAAVIGVSRVILMVSPGGSDSPEAESDVPLSNKTTPDATSAPALGSPEAVAEGSSSPDSGDEAVGFQKKAVHFELPAPARSPVTPTDHEIRRELLEITPTPSGRGYLAPTLLNPIALQKEIEERRRALDATHERLGRMLVDQNTSVHQLSERMDSVAEREAVRIEALRRFNKSADQVSKNIKIAQFLLIFFLIATVTMVVLKYKFPHRF
jgi:hypothetical protein